MDMDRRLKRLVAKPSREGEIPSACSSQTEKSTPIAPSLRSVVGAISGMATAWTVAGSAGLMARPLERAIAWLGIGILLAASWPRCRPRPKEVACLAASALAALVLLMPAASVFQVIAVTLVLSASAWMARGADRIALTSAAYGVAVLAVYRLAIVSTPVTWSATNKLGEALGAWAGTAFGKPLSIGATFAGLDFLVLMVAVSGVWIVQTHRPRWRRAIAVAAAIGLGHAVYLFMLAHANDFLAAIPKPPPVEPSPYQSDLYVPPPWYWGESVRWLAPWNFPLLAVVIHAAIAVGMFMERGALNASDPDNLGLMRTSAQAKPTFSLSPDAMGLVAVALAALVPATHLLSLRKPDLSNRKIVVYDHGSLDWGKPEFDRFGQESAGGYGMLAAYLQCLGAQCVEVGNPADRSSAESTSPQSSPSQVGWQAVSSAIASGTDVLMVIHPTRPWAAEEIEGVWNYVRGGGSLLVVAEPHVWEPDAKSSFNELLAPVGMEVRFDTAMPAARHWQHGVEPAVHPAAVGIDDASNGFGLAQAASIRHGWLAQPIVIGRWGWSDPGSDAVLTGVSRFDESERLGDLVLAAEQRVGKGRVVVLGDASALKNLGLAGGCEFLGRLLAYLASPGVSPQLSVWRQPLGLAATLGLVVLLGWRVEPSRLAAAVTMFALFVGLSMAVTAAGSQMLLDGRQQTPNPVACIDASHLPAASGEPWNDDGLAGLQLTLMRNGYLPLILRRWNEEQIQRAGMLIAIGPARAYSASERATVRRFLEEGGTMLCLAGANHAGPIESLLAECNLSVPRSPLRPNDPRTEPRPMGYFRTPYLDTGKYRVYMGLYAGWPVEGDGPGVELLVRGFDDLPVVMSARVGRGKLFLFGDTYFAANKNLEAEDGREAQVFRENAVFWRWFFAGLNGRPFVPPEPTSEPEPTKETMSDTEAKDAEMAEKQSPEGQGAPDAKP